MTHTRMNHRFAPVVPEFTRMLDDLLSDLNLPNGRESQQQLPLVNFRKTSEAWLLQIALPGLSKEKINIELNEGVLTISSHPEEGPAEKVKWSRREFDYTKFRRSFRLPEDADPEKVTAKYEDGVLNLHIALKEEQKPRKINVV